MMKHNILTLACAAMMGSAMIVPGGVWATGQGGMMGSIPQNTLSAQDRNFIQEAAQSSMAEIMLGRMAQQQAASNAVRQFSQQMVQDHNLANQKLMSIAQAKGVLLPPSQPDAKHQVLASELSTLSGPAFDQNYMQQMIKDHQKDLSDYQEMAQRTGDQDLKQYAQATLPILQMHLQMANQIVGGG